MRGVEGYRLTVDRALWGRSDELRGAVAERAGLNCGNLALLAISSPGSPASILPSAKGLARP